ncbi:MAG TPA: TetR/AcrR family transcriptional regulator [Solirubrobacteraceae bacterium]|jgi:AcrR family transcriptional regulator|nr:TetR/AcrR family transcriptional regulator [Solirubrobacteraceae bacterium]
MPPRPAGSDEINTPLQKSRKPTQRERLLRGMVTVANRDGYAGASVSQVIGEAGVSRPTFYDYFKDRDDCFRAAILEVHARLLGELHGAVEVAPAQEALGAAVSATLRFALAEPGDARFLMKESLAGGPGALDARDRGIRESAELVERAVERSSADALAPDVPVAAVLGALQRLLASRLRRGERAPGALEQELLAWLHSYDAPVAALRWRALEQHAAPERSPYLPPTSLRPPAKLPAGRPRLPPEEILENQRRRVMFATAQVVQERGYTAATIAEIIKRAGVEGRRFYLLFADKQEAFGAIHELGFQYLMAATAGAFFAGESWPQRIWEAFRATTQSIDDTPAFAHIAFVEAYAVGPGAIQRVEDSRAAFTIFLQEGYRYQDASQTPPRVALEAIVTTIFEIVYLETRARGEGTAGLLALLVHMCLAPFMGAAASDELIDAQLAAMRPAGSGEQRGVRAT